MTALETTLDVLNHATRYSVKQAAVKFPGSGPWLLSNINGPYGLYTIIGIDAAHTAGVDPMDRTPFIVAMIDSLTRSHRSQPSVWPSGQKNDWAKSIARAQFMGYLVEMALRYWSQLSPTTQARLIQCVEYDVSREVVKYWKKPDGAFHPGMKSGDSKVEEVAFTLYLAHAAESLGLDYTALGDEALAAFSVPQDGLSQGYNVDADFLVENHMLNRADGTRVVPGDPTGVPIKPNPHYQKAALVAEERVGCLSQIGNREAPNLYRRLPEVWEVLAERDYPVSAQRLTIQFDRVVAAAGWTAPGGRIYQNDGFIRFPRGSDLTDAVNRAGAYSFALTDAIVSRHHPNLNCRTAALYWCERHMRTAHDQQMAQQVRMGSKWDGRMSAPAAPGPNQKCAMLVGLTFYALTR